MKNIAKNVTISNNNSLNSGQEILLLQKAISQLSNDNKKLSITRGAKSNGTKTYAKEFSNNI